MFVFGKDRLFTVYICFKETLKVWRLIYAFWYLPTYATYAKILAHVRDHVRRFYIIVKPCPHWELFCRNKWHPGISEISSPPEIARTSNTRTSKREHGTKTTPVFLPAYGEASWSLLPIQSPYSAPRKHLLLYSQGDRSGLKKPKMDKH